MKERNIILSIVLTILTCGIYGIIWQWSLNNEIRIYNKKTKNSAISFLLSIVTCGIYFLIWMYNLGKEVEEIGGDKNSSLIYLLFSFFALPIVGIAMAQNEVNKLCKKENILQ